MQTDPSNGEGSSSRTANSQYNNTELSETSPLLDNNVTTYYDSASSKRKDKYPARSTRSGQQQDLNELDRYEGEVANRQNFFELVARARIRWKFYCILFSLMSISLVLVAALLLLTPEYAQRSLEDGVQVQFQEASIVNATDDGDISILAVHVVGELLLQKFTYKLAKKASWLFGDITTRQSRLQIYYIPESSKQQQNKHPSAMGTITLPSLTLSSHSPITQFSFDTQIVVSSTAALMDFCADAVVSPTVSWKVSGPVGLQVGWFSPDIKLERQITLEGMDGLKEATIQSISFPGAHPLGGIALEGAVAIYNPSSMLSLTLGDVDFGIFLPDTNSTQADDLMIAVVRAKDAALLGKQYNIFKVSGRSLPLDDNDARGKQLMENFLSTYLRGNDSAVHVRGSSFGPDQDVPDQTSATPGWLRKALQSLTLAVPFPGTKETELIRSLELSNIKIDFSRQGDPLISGDVAALLKKPDEMKFSMNVTSILPHVYIYLQQNSSSPFGQLVPDRPCPAITKEGNGSKDAPLGMLKVFSKIQRAPFKVLPGKDDDFQKFLNQIFYGRGGEVYIRGSAQAQVDSPFGHLNIHDLAFHGEIDTKGMKGLIDPPPKASSISLIKGDPDMLHLSCVLLIENPSDVDVNLGHINVLLEYDGQVIGDATIKDMHLLPERKNEFVAAGRLFLNGLATSPSPMIDFVGSYISGDEKVSLTISGQHPNATASDLLKVLINHLEFTVEPPPFEEQPLLADMQMNILSSTTVMWLCNPFENIVIQLLKLNGTAVYGTHEIGTAVANFEDLEEGWEGPVVLPPLACQTDSCMAFTVETPKIPVMTKKLGFEAIRKALGGEIAISVASFLKIKIDQLELDGLRYQRNNLTMKVRKGF